MGYWIAPRHDTRYHALIGFVTGRDWMDRVAEFERWLAGHPDRVLVLECHEVTGFEPAALVDLARVICSARRVRLRGWRSEFVVAAFPPLRRDGNAATTNSEHSLAAQSYALDSLVSKLCDQIAELWPCGAERPGSDG